MQLFGFPGIVVQRPTVSTMAMQMNPSAGVVSPPLTLGPPGVPGTAPNTDPGGSQNVVTMCPDGTTPSSIGCIGPNGVTTTANVVQTYPTNVALPTSFPWLQVGLGVIGAIVGGLVGRHYKRPVLGAGIGGAAAYFGGGLALQNVSFSVGG